MRCRAAGVLVGAIAAIAMSGAVAQADPAPFGHPCTAQNGVRFCPTSSLSQRVPSWDGTPLDVDVTLPATGSGPWPTIVMLHGLGGDKTMFEDTSADGSQALTYHYNNTYYAQQGYAVVNYSSRGFGNSCGLSSSRTSDCAHGWVHLDDTRYEARDTQYLLGLLVDEGIAAPNALGVTGVSYGGGGAAELAFLKNRIRLPDGGFAPWTSPNGTPLSIAAAYPRWGWADLAAALVPNGRLLDTQAPSYAADTSPVGVMKLSYVTFLYLITQLTGYVAPAGVDPSADLTNWYTRLLQGEPYTDSESESVLNAVAYDGTDTIPGAPSPMLIENGWTDDLFTAQQGVALYNQALAADPNADVSLQFADTGHPPASNRSDVVDQLVNAGDAFFNAKLKGAGSAPAPRSATLYPMTCPAGSPTGAPIVASSWAATHPGTLTFSSSAFQGTASSGLNYLGQASLDPIIPLLTSTVSSLVTGLLDGQTSLSSLTSELTGGSFGTLFTTALQGSNPCQTYPATPATNSVSVNAPVRWRPYTLAGMPTITLNLFNVGANGQLDAHLWDVKPNGTEILVSRGVYRLTNDQSGTVTFQLAGNDYTFAAGDQARVEILATDSPYLRPSNGVNATFVTKATVSLPTLQTSP